MVRKTTKRRTYGRANVAQALRAARQELVDALGQYSDVDPPEVAVMRRVAKDLTRAVESYDLYGLKGRRLRDSLEEIKEIVEEKISEVMELAITPDEKVLAKHSATTPVLTPTSPANVNAAPPLAPTSTKEPSQAIKASGVPKTTSRRSSSGQARTKRKTAAVQGKGKRASHVARSSSKRADSHPQRRKRAPAKKSGK